MNFALPVCRSSFSLLHGTASPESLVKAAVEYNHPAIILADHNNLYGCYDFYYAARETGLKPIIGAEVAAETGNLLLICLSHDGFKNLSKIITHYQLHGAPSANTLNDNRGDIICIVENNSSLNILKEIFGSSLYMKINCEKPSHAIRLAHNNNIKPVACPDVHFLRYNDFEKHCLLKAIDGGYLLANIPKTKVANKGDYLRNREWYNNYYSPFPEAVGNSQEIIERCNLIFPERKNILPDIEIDGDHFGKLKNDALEGLRGKLPNLSGRYLSRLKYELSVIRRTGFVDYFLIVEEIIDFCRRGNITAVGRGSAAGSLVS
jgi:DNA polymerase III alpha subunit